MTAFVRPALWVGVLAVTAPAARQRQMYHPLNGGVVFGNQDVYISVKALGGQAILKLGQRKAFYEEAGQRFGIPGGQKFAHFSPNQRVAGA